MRPAQIPAAQQAEFDEACKIEVKPINPFDTESTVMGQPIY